MTTTTDARGYSHKLVLPPTTDFALTVTLVGLAVGSVGNWAATVVKNPYDAPAATLITPTIAVNGTTNTITVTFTAANLTTLLSTGQAKFNGYWQLRNTATPFELIAAPFVVDRNGGATGTSSDLTLTVSSTAITATFTSGLPRTMLFTSLAKSLEEIIEGTITRDSNEAVTSAGVVWPDGTPGVFTATTLSTLFPGAVDAYTVTYLGAHTVTYTQPLMTRDASGAVTTRPAMTIS